MYHGWHYRFKGYPLFQKGLDGGNPFIVNTARHNQSEVAQVRVHVQGETMHGHPVTYLDAHRCYFLIANPHACEPWLAVRFNPKVAQGNDNRLFQPAQIEVDIPAVLT
jgi:hypothetical protein